jgi:RNA polymerase sigma factor (sigma-70 family)
VGSPSTAEEVVQDVLAGAYASWGKLSRLDRPGAWLRRAVINRSISVTRRRESEHRALARLRQRTPTEVAAPETPMDELWAAVRELPENQATAIALRYGADLSLADVAEEMDLTEAAVRTLLHRARQALRSELTIEEMVQ